MMKFKIINDYRRSPQLVFDGSEPKAINYKIKDKKGKILCKVDLWEKLNDPLEEKIHEEDFNEIDKILKFPRKKILRDKEIFSHLDGFWPVDLVKCEDFIIYFSFSEASPSRYQAYVLAVLEKKE
jgi:hypothetical protein